MSVILPAPPSANQMYKIVNRKRVKTKRYARWCKVSVGYLMLSPLPTDAAQDAPARRTAGRCLASRRDLDNLIKPTLDALQACGVIHDDRWVDSIIMNRVTGSGRLADGDIELFVGLLN